MQEVQELVIPVKVKKHWPGRNHLTENLMKKVMIATTIN